MTLRRQRGESSGPLLLRLPNWIGDAIMAAPAVERVVEAVAPRPVHLLGIAPVLELFRGFQQAHLHRLPALGERASRPDRLFERAMDLRKTRYEGALILPPSFSSAAMSALSGASLRVGWPTDGRKPLLTCAEEAPNRTTHLRGQYDRLARLFLRKLGCDESPITSGDPAPATVAACFRSGTPRLPLWGDELQRARAWWADRGLDPSRTVGLAPGAIYGPTKRWSPDRYLELARRLLDQGYNVVWLGGPAEADLAQSLQERLLEGVAPNSSAGAQSVSVAGRMALRDSLALMSFLAATVSNDSGAMHLADAAGTPVVGIFGSTSPDWTGPVGEHAVVARQPVPCAPCFSRSCPTQIECLRDLTVDHVHQALTGLLELDRSESPALFLDRDGTLLEPVPYISDPADVRLLPGAAPALRAARQAGFLVIVVTNQSGIARGRFDDARLAEIHRQMERLLADEGAQVDGIEWCPHHPDYDRACACRKPSTGMIDRAVHRWGIDRTRSMVIGDSRVDLEVARAAGLPFTLVRTGYGRELEREWLERSQRTSNVPGLVTSREVPTVTVSDDIASAIEGILSEAPSHK